MTKIGAKDIFLAGVVSSAQGIRGQVKVYSYLESPENFKKYKLYDSNGVKLGAKYSFSKKNFAILSLENIKDRNQAQELANQKFEIYIKRADLDGVDEGEFYNIDLIGLRVIELGQGELNGSSDISNNHKINLEKVKDITEKELGHITNILNFGAGDIVEVELKSLSEEGKRKKELIAFNEQNFPYINIEENLIIYQKVEILFDNK